MCRFTCDGIEKKLSGQTSLSKAGARSGSELNLGRWLNITTFPPTSRDNLKTRQVDWVVKWRNGRVQLLQAHDEPQPIFLLAASKAPTFHNLTVNTNAFFSRIANQVCCPDCLSDCRFDPLGNFFCKNFRQSSPDRAQNIRNLMQISCTFNC